MKDRRPQRMCQWKQGKDQKVQEHFLLHHHVVIDLSFEFHVAGPVDSHVVNRPLREELLTNLDDIVGESKQKFQLGKQVLPTFV